MGDRGNIAVLQSDGDQVWFYAHWHGSEMKSALKEALIDGKARWNDESYLARIILCRLIPEKLHSETAGFGISCRIQDNEHRVLVCDINNQRVFEIEEALLNDGRVPVSYEPIMSVSFEQFVGMKTDSGVSLKAQAEWDSAPDALKQV